MGQCLPSKDESVKTLKQLGSAAMGMVGALALNEALKATFEEFGPGAKVAYALLVSFLSVVILAILKLFVEGKAEQAAGERGKAMVQLFKVSFCLLSASAWNEVISLSENEWELLGIALGLTLLLIVLLIIVFKTYDWWQSASCKASCPGPCAGLVTGFLTGLVLWTPITFGFVCGVAWNEFFSQLITGNLGDGAEIVVAFLYALFTVPLAIGIILITQRVKESGWGSCCPGPIAQPCCGLENKIADPLSSMFEGEAAAIMAFAWNSAFETVWRESTDTSSADGNNDDTGGKLGILIAYALVATIFGVLAVLLIKKCVG